MLSAKSLALEQFYLMMKVYRCILLQKSSSEHGIKYFMLNLSVRVSLIFGHCVCVCGLCIAVNISLVSSIFERVSVGL